MADDDEGLEGEKVLLERIREAVAEKDLMELVRINTDGPEVTAVVEVYAMEDGERKLIETSLYDIHREPRPESVDGTESLGDEGLSWTYLGSVEDAEDRE